METKRWKITNETSEAQAAISEAASLLKKGETIAFPTETVYGLGADATNPEAVNKIFAAKGRPQDNPLIAHVATKEQLLRLVYNVPDYAAQLMDAFSPGPLTYVLKTSGVCADNVTAGQETIGVRMPSHPVAQALLKACDIPIAAPSANLSGKPSPTTAVHVWEDLQGKIAGVVDGGPTGFGVESTVLDCTQEIPVILRPGGVTKEQLTQIIGMVVTDPGLANSSEKPKAPGMKYRHYAPEVPLLLVYGTPKDVQATIDKAQAEGKKVGALVSDQTAAEITAFETIRLGKNLPEVAAHLYDGLRKFKTREVDVIVSEAFPEDGIGQAVMNRLRKAASKHIHMS
ncbi:L-threonylcarbamoyladenylate synthase [Virgibacillus sp. 179-BFC.A HS]|uniref:Threonylcarbamoyl-AMP synthase n=1 Tax=Tigheibacillus jepli TaxID=3035914 RepID=A0ABU5CDY3_9BACI|nr:L-threonylcarbamoyladenylate synthase [Virgibacillus sp. 179-BFC.A HS]MDY0404553.1 L-threonylcarbamoyladenylate synthase [Virgibacillus sp. 179-BFC.A HS]